MVKGFGEAGGMPRVAAILTLWEYNNISSADIFVSQGVSYVKVDGKTYRIADEVECYKAASEEWFTQENGADRLAACKAFSNNLTIYVDPVGEKVRVIVAK